jgi:Raf kinase inhibitor-like YbhB/YbcL family protein
MPSDINTLELRSDIFKSQDMIPEKYSCDGEDISPQLSWSQVPDGTVELVLICDDPDAPMGTFIHWAAYGIPPGITNLPENVAKKDTTMGFKQGKNSFGKIGYGGPCPPRGSTHRYYFRLYAVDKSTDLKPGSTKEAVMKAIDGHILAQGELIGRYGR